MVYMYTYSTRVLHLLNNSHTGFNLKFQFWSIPVKFHIILFFRIQCPKVNLLFGENLKGHCCAYFTVCLPDCLTDQITKMCTLEGCLSVFLKVTTLTFHVVCYCCVTGVIFDLNVSRVYPVIKLSELI